MGQLYFGPADEMPPAHSLNPKGCFENLRVEELIREILQTLGAHGHRLQSAASGWEHQPWLAPLRKRARRLGHEFPRERRWGWKWTISALTLPFW